jgi:hypothetical protein
MFDELAFADLYSHICTLAEQLKSEYVISEATLGHYPWCRQCNSKSFRISSQVKKGVKLANDFEMVLSLVAVGEAPK